MITVFSLAAFLALVVWLFARRTAEAVAGFFLLFPFVTRSLDAAYVDLFGPVYASELGRYVGGGASTPVFVYSAFSFILPLVFVFRGSAPPIVACRERPSWTPFYASLSNLGLIGVSLVVLALYTNMLIVGTIPLLEGIDRIQYGIEAGLFHRGMYELNFLMNFVLGALTVLPRLNGRDYDLRFTLVSAALLFYWVLTGNRFSVFFVQLSFYFMPFAAVLLGQRVGAVGPLGPNSRLQRFLTSRVLRYMGILFAVVCLGGLIMNSYYNVRNYRDPLEQIEERILIQPIELWAGAWERVDFAGRQDLVSRDALQGIIFNPIDATRNTSIQYLMTQELGYFRSAELARNGQQYTGGYPEIFFAMFNPWLALLLLPITGLITALLIRYSILLLYRNMIISSVLAIYVYFGFSLLFLGGFIIFLFAPTYALKVVALLVAIVAERQFVAAPRAAARRRAAVRRVAFRSGPEVSDSVSEGR